MKKNFFIMLLALCGTANAQFSKLFDFNSANGGQSRGSLVYDGNFLYGMSYSGGVSGYGLIYKISPDGSTFDTLMSFKGMNGAFPTSSLYYDGTWLYGMTDQGGTGSQGVLFRILPDGSGYTKLADFTGATNGGHPGGVVTSDGTWLYGTTGQGGSNGQGTIFKIMPSGTGFTTMYHFGTAGYDGSGDGGGLYYDGTWLYGTTNQGGTNGQGSIYRIKTDGTGYSKIFSFPGTPGAAFPEGHPISDGTWLYGMTHYGGASQGGVLYKILPDGTGFTIIHNFTGYDGCTPMGSLLMNGAYLYGTTIDGGLQFCNNGNGIIFKIKPDGTGFTKLHDFDGINDGGKPYCTPCLAGSSLYGTTYSGGANNKGTIFRYYSLNIAASMASDSICSNQCNGSATVNVISGTPPYSYAWSTSPVQTTDTATGLCAGITYTVTVTDSLGSAVDSVTIAALSPTPAPEICAITVDSLSEYNIILWDKTPFAGGAVDTFVVLREIATGNYQPIGKVPYNNPSQFTDTARMMYFPNTGNPNIGTYRYKLAAHDTCGMLSPPGSFHNTIYITNNAGTFSWNLYEIEGNPNPVNSYILMRDDNNTGNWHTVASVSGTQQTVSDPDYYTYKDSAAWRVQTQWGISCNPSKAGNKLLTLNYSLSNIYLGATEDISENEIRLPVTIIPNPASDQLTIQTVGGVVVEIRNIQGQLVESFVTTGEISQVDISQWPCGLYIVKVQTASSNGVKRFVKQN